MNPFQISSLHGGEMYTLLYLAAFLTSSAVFILSGLKHKYPFQMLWLVTTAGTLFFILGNKFFAIDPRDWVYLFTDTEAVSHGAKTILGGLLGLIIGSIVIVIWLKGDIRLADLAAIGLPLSMAVTRLGCLFSGCCYGKPTDLPWGIQYTPGHHAFDSQAARGLIDHHAALSLPVHPVQVYDILCCILIAVFIWKYTGFLRARGNKFAFSFLLYGCARFFLEFLRDPATNFYGGGTWLGVKYIQWILLGAVMLLGTVILIREKRVKSQNALTWPENRWTGRPVSLLLFLCLVYFMLFNWFDALERTMIGLMLIPAMVMMAMSFAGTFILPRYRLVTSMVLLSCLLFMSQTYNPTNTSNKLRYFEVGAGGLFGKYYSETAQVLYQDWTPGQPGGVDCEGNPYDSIPPQPGYYYLSGNYQMEHQYRFYGINASYHVRDGAYKRMAAGLNGFYGVDKESYSMPDTATYAYVFYTNSNSQYAINPYVSFDLKNIGFDVGFHAGNFTLSDKTDQPTMTEPVPEVPTSHFYPQFGFRLGPQHILYLDTKYCGAFPTPFPENKFSIGLASGLGFWNGVKLGTGYSTAGYYTTGTLVIKDRVVLDATFIDNLGDEGGDRYTFSFALRYRFGYKLQHLVKK